MLKQFNTWYQCPPLVPLLTFLSILSFSPNYTNHCAFPGNPMNTNL